jgi:hypothetical protein
MFVLLAPFVLGTLVLGMLTGGCASTKQSTFSSPDDAVKDLIGALKPMDKDRLIEIFGPESDDLVSSGDEVADRAGAERFVALYTQKHELVTEKNGGRTLLVGPDAWPFPIPLVNQDGHWTFDTESGKDEILNRRIGDNELSTIQVCLAVVDAEREYAERDPMGHGLNEYTQKFFSDPGQRNGLYWPTNPGETPSPLGPLVADASDEGYTRKDSAGEASPYHGYHYRALLSQGEHANGGAFEYIVNGKMIGGFGLVAWPAAYGNSGIMTFVTSQDGVVFQKDLGADTDKIAKAMTQFDPGTGWTKVETER